jgi:hypothetical protein
MAIPIIDTVLKAAQTAVDKIWMDKDKKEQLKFDREKLHREMEVALRNLEQTGELKKIESDYKEAQSQRDYANTQFGTASVLKDFFLGKIILLGRASIRWVITGFAMWQAHRLVSVILTKQTIAAFAAGTLSTSAIWLVSLLVVMILGIPLFYVTGVTIEKLFKSRGIL